MTVAEIKLLAFNQTEPPVSLNLAERLLYLTLSDVYRRFRNGDISQLEGDRLFKEASASFHHNAEAIALSDRIIQNHAEMWKRIESAAANYMMSGSRTKEADEFVEAVYGCKMKGVDSDSNT